MTKIPPAPSQGLEYWTTGSTCCNQRWEAAYQRFETPAQEVSKFKARLRSLGVTKWDREARIVELFCGRGSGLHALQALGFQNLCGLDLSSDLLGRFEGSARLIVGDCTQLHFEPESIDVFIIQGGLHHLPQFPEDLERCISEMARCLRPGGKVLVVEPWNTPFLNFVHACCNSPLRNLWGKLDALATMIEEERETYERWLAQPRTIRTLMRARFDFETERTRFGKWMVVATKPTACQSRLPEIPTP